MKDQHTLIKGYRDLTQEEIDLMNEIKAHGEELKAMLYKLSNTPNLDRRWISISRDHLQQGIMAAVRSVAQPESF